MTGDDDDVPSPMDEVMENISRELVRTVAAADRAENREIYDDVERE